MAGEQPPGRDENAVRHEGVSGTSNAGIRQPDRMKLLAWAGIIGNFVIFGLLTIAYAVGLQLGVEPTKAGSIGPALLLLSGIGLLFAAIFPLREDAAGGTYDLGGYLLAGLTFFLSSAVGLVFLSRRLARDPRWLQRGFMGSLGMSVSGNFPVRFGCLTEWGCMDGLRHAGWAGR